ncbi:MAG TPA: hypothetical protein VF131_24165 [Blastocatellia bacterium]|nr:hypothetical protein [Blastocatellia bacterium]
MNLKLNRLFFAALVATSVFTLACGGDSKHAGQPSKYPAGSVTSEDIANRLKFDARVDTYDNSDEKKLVVHVHQSWVASPPGLKERSLHEWYSMWHASHDDAKGLEVEVQHEGVPVAKYTTARGYEIVEQKKSDDSGSSS